MIRSMTGFGQSESQSQSFTIRVEIKSLNGKFMDLNLRLPRILNEKEHQLRSKFGKLFVRGSVTMNIYLERSEENQDALRLNTTLAEKYFRELSGLATNLGADTKGLFTSITGFPDVLKAQEAQLGEEDWNAILDVCGNAYENFNNFRLSEGKEMGKILGSHNSQIHKVLLPKVDAYENKRREEVRTRLNQAFKENESAVNVDANRFEQELIYYLEKYDISEEKNRLAAHCEHFNDELQKGAGGKKLGFIAQEIGREVNTMGAKAYHAPLQKVVIDMKEELEKIKEQVLNVL